MFPTGMLSSPNSMSVLTLLAHHMLVVKCPSGLWQQRSEMAAVLQSTCCFDYNSMLRCFDCSDDAQLSGHWPGLITERSEGCFLEASPGPLMSFTARVKGPLPRQRSCATTASTCMTKCRSYHRKTQRPSLACRLNSNITQYFNFLPGCIDRTSSKVSGLPSLSPPSPSQIRQH